MSKFRGVITKLSVMHAIILSLSLSLTLGCVPCVHPCALRRGTDPDWQHDVADIQDLRSPTAIPIP